LIAEVRSEKRPHWFFGSRTYYQTHVEMPYRGRGDLGNLTRLREEAVQGAYDYAKRFAGVLAKGTGFSVRDRTARLN
jgi:hypothetical protein